MNAVLLGLRQTLARESVSSVFSIEMSHLAWIDPIPLYSTTLWINIVKVNHVFEMVEMVYVEYFV